jgi:hypothetical protein
MKSKATCILCVQVKPSERLGNIVTVHEIPDKPLLLVRDQVMAMINVMHIWRTAVARKRELPPGLGLWRGMEFHKTLSLISKYPHEPKDPPSACQILRMKSIGYGFFRKFVLVQEAPVSNHEGACENKSTILRIERP